MPVATVAFQTMGNWPKEGDAPADGNPESRPYFIDGCKAWAADGPVVERLFPVHFAPKPAGGA